MSCGRCSRMFQCVSGPSLPAVLHGSLESRSKMTANKKRRAFGLSDTETCDVRLRHLLRNAPRGLKSGATAALNRRRRGSPERRPGGAMH